METPFILIALRRALSLLVLGLTACSAVGPDYLEPNVDWLDRWQLSVPTAKNVELTKKQIDLQFWWQRFNDPVLNQLIVTAKQDNPSLRIAGLRIFESRALMGIAGSSLYPQVQQATGSANYINTQSSGDSGNQSFGSYQAGLNLGWEMDFWGRFRRGIESADAAFFASVANQADIQVLVSAQVTDLYYAYRITEARIIIASKNAAIQKRSYELTQELFKSGSDSELDLQQAKTQYLATLSSIPQLEITLVNTRNALGVLLGRAPGNMPELIVSDYTLPATSAKSVKDIPAQLLLRRPDVRAAAWQVAAQSAQIGIAEADYYPSISLIGSLGWSDTSISGSASENKLILGPSLKWNIFDYGRIDNSVRVQDARLQQLIEKYQDSVLQAAREIDDAVYGVLKTAEQQLLIDESAKAAQRALDIANTRYKEGYADFQRVLDAQRALFSQAERQVVNRGTHISAVISLYKGLGGGWTAASPHQLISETMRKTMLERSDWDDLLSAPLPQPPTPSTSPSPSTSTSQQPSPNKEISPHE